MGITHITAGALASDSRVRSEADELLARIEKQDRVAAFSEAFLAGMREARWSHEHFLALIDDTLVGIAGLSPDGSAELAVEPTARGRGIGTTLAKAVLKHHEARDNDGGNNGDASLGFWAHGNLPAAQSVANRLDLTPRRTLLVMEIEGEALDAITDDDAWAKTQAELAEQGLGLETYGEAVDKYGANAVDRAWLAVNNDAFSWHPEQGGWDIERLRAGMNTQWFDPHGVILLWDFAGHESGDGEPATLVGFHWTKMHVADSEAGAAGDEHGAKGEVYVVGLSSAYRGRGLGDPLMRAGLVSLRKRGDVSRVVLYVEEDNKPAVARYRQLGFTVVEHHVVYAR
ncbi:mycothiol synthase [Corynebacterium aquatimens]|uniref:Mycothiol acetyltransferase n=1 Tax=Corynebacterium aquatimens TaxID=1190508 RepID=A0A931E1Q8_9CORY|nr:mycothiol synthase [Corynebacterium aquatimens]MBG6122287.1 mycothiol synthase [Corynebacterium aquatimens]WJY65172.1 Mycothiol acetyltransferase [Corynebacterium aquatimens]